MLKYRSILLLFLLIPAAVFCQDKTFTDKLVSTIDTFCNRIPAEKVFVQTDKPYYTNTDTLWLKAYVLDAALNYSQQSGLLYTELINDTGKVIIRQVMPVKLGISFGQIALDPNVVPEGSYTLRTYTNWMQNQGEQSFFTRQFYISAVNENPWLVNTDNKLIKKPGLDNLEMVLLFTGANNNPIRLREMQLKIKNGDKLLSKDNLQTDLTGKLNFNFNLPEKANTKRLVILAQDMRKGQGNKTLIIPVTITRPENTDLQFMPEGGQLVAGLPCHVGFKAIGEDGKGTAISGNIMNSKGTLVTQFKSVHSGMGSFELVPQAGENYTAQVTGPNGIIKTYPLPLVKTSGICLHIDNPVKSDSLSVTINATTDILTAANRYSLIAQSGGRVCYAANLSLIDGIIHGRISKDRFRSGIVHFILFNADEKPITERLTFIDHRDELHISINTDKQAYQPKDSIALHINITDKDNKPASGSFSLAVTDDNDVKANSSNISDIVSYLLLTGDLKGNIEQPGYYFDNKNIDRNTALDNLLLTQGWVGYDWANIFNPKYRSAFKAEHGFEVNGQISRVGGKAVGGLPVMLLSTKKPLLVTDTISDAKGHFSFKNLPQIDTPNLMVQVKDKKGRMFEANISVDEFTPANVNLKDMPPLKPWYVNSDSTLLNYMNQSRAYNKELDKIKYPEGTRQLKEVVIKAKKVVKDSHNLNGTGNADQVLDEKDLLKAGKTTLMDLLYTRIKGFKKYGIYDKGLKFVFDGVNADFFFDKNIDYNPYQYYERLLSQYSAEDIKGIEVMYNNSYNGKYTVSYNPEIVAFSPRSSWPAYIEITTWSGNGLFQKRKHSNYLYRPLPVTWPKQFYKPRYTTKSNNTFADLRSTIHWEPNIITDSAGKATVWFYAKGKPSHYTGIMQGSDLSGEVGVGRVKISVK